MRISRAILPLVLCLAAAHPCRPAAALDLTVRGVGLSLGNSPRATGIRINAVDGDVRRVDGLNFTLWNPRPSPEADFNGLALGLIGPKAGRVRGLAVGGIGATATDRICGLAAGGFGCGAERLDGIALGGLLAEIRQHSRGLLVSPGACRAGARLTGIALGGAGAAADSARGVLAGGLVAFGHRIDGLAVSAGVAGCDGDLRGVCVGGLVAGGRNLSGITVSCGGVFAAGDLRGIALGGLGVSAEGRVQGLALGGLVSLAPEVAGVSFGALNGVIVKSINLEDFLEISTVNKSYTGLSLGLVNYSARLRGVQIGLLNYAANNPKWARLLPLVNAHF